jgi:protocatechuate 3,4-dioxygenase beta subunit
LLVVSCAAALAQSPAPPQASGIIIGQVLDATTSRPVPEAVVQLRRGSGRDAPSGGRVIADVEGRYFFAGLTAATYTIHATKVGYASGAYGARRPPSMLQPLAGTAELTLLSGMQVLNADILLWKHASINGVVTDERGEPMAGIVVRPLRRTVASGRPRFVGTAGSIAMTDDRGMYRLSALPPGHYVISVMATQATLPASVLADHFDNVGAAAKANLFAVSPEISRPGSSGTQQFGDQVLVTFSGLPIPLVSSETSRLSVYQTTYAPGVGSIGDATVISLTAGEDRAGVAIPMRPVPSVRVSGRLIGPSGPAGLEALRLIPAGIGDLIPESPFSAATVMTDAAGEFTFLGVPPGAHTLRVDVLPRGVGGAQASMREMLWASQAVIAGSADISDLVVTLRRAVPVNGRVVLSPAPGTQTSAATAPGLDVNVSFPQDLGPVAAAAVRANAQGEFSTGLPGGSYYVTPQLPAGWFVKSIVVNDRAIGDASFEAAGDGLNITITATNVAARVAVTVRDAESVPPGTSVSVFLFPADRSAWTGYGPGTRRLQTLRGNRSVGSIFEGMPAGEYFIAAARDEFTADWPDPRWLDILSRLATRVTIADGQAQSVDIRMAPIR